jgi:hypothetical protein
MLDDATELLVCAWQETWHISEGDDGNLVGIAESDKSGSFEGGVNVQAASQDLWLVGDYAYSFAFDISESSDDISSKVRHDLIHLVSI